MTKDKVESRLMKIWRWNEVTGYWKYERDCYRENTENWLKIFSDDEPGVVFRASNRRPVKAPAARN